MKAFATLYRRLDETSKTSLKVSAMAEFFSSASPDDSAWAIYFLSGRKLKRLVLMSRLRSWAAEAAGIPDWLFEESYEAVGDLAETMSLILPGSESEFALTLADCVEKTLLPLRGLAENEQRHGVVSVWNRLSPQERFVWNKLITGAFRVGVSRKLVVRALAETTGLPAATLAHRLMGNWEPTTAFFATLTALDDDSADLSRPFPFRLAYPLADVPDTLGDISDWLVEWKWDGIRSQLIRRQGETFLWSRGEELITERFPDLGPVFKAVPNGTVLDGEVVGWKDGRVLPFTELQRRIGRKTVGKKLRADVPAMFIAFDMLEWNGEDIRSRPTSERRQALEQLVGSLPGELPIQISERVDAADWQSLRELRQSSRERGVEGLMLKSIASPYGVGRVTGQWWKWKVDPFSVDAVLIYAQRGSGRRASLYTDYTFGVWDNGELVSFAKAYSGLTDDEIQEVDRFVRQNTVGRFGPVRSVTPELVFELHFENIQPSKRHKSGIAVRFPRMHRWRRDKKPADADTLTGVKALANTPDSGTARQDREEAGSHA